MLTAWDGFARVDYLPIPGRVQVTLSTVEPTVFGRPRRGLACAFAADDTGGPPTFVEVDIGFGLTEDEEVLLGGPLMAVVNGLVGGGPEARCTRLTLDEVTALARTWAPYRDRVLARPLVEMRSGTWTNGLWTSLAGLGLVAALRARPMAVELYRDEAEEVVWHDVLLPVDLAALAMVDQEVRWSVYREWDPVAGREETGVVVRATGSPGSAPRLLVGFDDGDGDWVPLVPEPTEPQVVIAVLPLDPGTGEPALRFRTGGRTDG
ncbi:hypothetical protein [Umezawaea tangerina]|uniref:Uncharacterized protein n=1 Tax=Umezawaea tangerina TaxID=84725 RepID=A0A2T0SLI7_9PSEU|nr:hypothetical protein [Umezawaea tangerina]PRY34266.1 hypothetical protein CLV43_11739 [Umezawaea tangerina]